MQAQPNQNALDAEGEGRQPFIKIGEKPSIDLAIDELSTVGRTPEAHLQSKIWQNIPLLLRDWNSSVDENKMKQLLKTMNIILQGACEDEVRILNRDILKSSLEAMLTTQNLNQSTKLYINLCLTSLSELHNGPMILIEKDVFNRMETSFLEPTNESDERKQQIEANTAKIEQLQKQIEAFERQRAEEEEQRRCGVPVHVGTSCITTLDETVHEVTGTELRQKVALEGASWRTAFTRPLDKGEWELKINGKDGTLEDVRLGFLKHPLPDDAVSKLCGLAEGDVGGYFRLDGGSMWFGGIEFKPTGTNKKCDRVGQTAAIRVNMMTKEARLFVDDEEQPGIFTGIPSPLCLAISTGGDIKTVQILGLNQFKA
ncbi:hypothetical protein BLNAU_23284 [Blattamonas nauphoetae]|uniref:SPRY domain-containing protein n=1 Tax=Blattamonas nauphoetae TaxID=2049346 RepID=A0ABQ9WTQ4_9EUKA|nr:hypothetical protein BLNAU_23284 [Blattamonas nauphoetae]